MKKPYTFKQSRFPQRAFTRGFAAFFIFGGIANQSFSQSDDDVFELSPFEVNASDDDGYRATHTLAGTRIRTELKDVGSAISVITEEFMKDVGATDNGSLLTFTTGTEVGGPTGNFAGAGNGGILQENFQNPSQNTRVRGLSSADNTIDFFLTSIPWDSYNVDRIDVQRGPNSILFGFGSPAGIINASRVKPMNVNETEVGIRLDDQGSLRLTADVNRVILEDELSVRFALLDEGTKFRQRPALEDDRRIFATLKYEPKFLRSDFYRTTLRTSFESGKIDANRPRAITPIDNITPWFRPVSDPNGGLGKGTFSPVQIQVSNPLPGQTNVGQLNSNFNDGTLNPAFLPALGGFPQSFGGIHITFDPDTGILKEAYQTKPEVVAARGIDSAGEIDGGISGLPFQGPGAVDRFPEIARKLGLPFEELGQYKNQHMLDPTIFDFWNQHLDGPTKRETQEWDHFSASLAQTFFNNKLGYEASLDSQAYDQTKEQTFTGGRQEINIDINTHLGDGSLNPNVGRPFISDTGQFGQSGNFTKRDSYRLTAFAEHDFTGKGSNDAWWSKLLGRHVVTGLVSSEEMSAVNQSWNAYGTDESYGTFIGDPDTAGNIRQFNAVVYLGPDLRSADAASGLNIQGLRSPLIIPDSVSTRVFDSTWNGGSIDPAAAWDSTGDGTLNSTESENPANYIGWVNREVQMLKANEGYRDFLSRQLQKSNSVVDSEALVLQSFLWDGALVGTYGWRSDINESFAKAASIDPVTKKVLHDTAELPDEPDSTIDVQSTSWSVAAHIDQLLGLKDILPVNVSLYYNESSNFQPAAGRIDLYGNPLSSPSGSTIDRSILISSKENRYSFKVTRFTTKVVDDTADRVGNSWYVGQFMNRGDNATSKFEFDIAGNSLGVPNFGNTYQPRPEQTVEEAAAEEASAVAGWRNLQQAVFDLSEELTGDPHAFYTTFSSDPTVAPPAKISTLRPPSQFAITQDALSQGYEYEFSAQPTKNWRVSMNAAQVEAIRTNIGGDTFVRHVNLVENLLNTTDAGNLRVFSGGANAETQLGQWNRVFGGKWELTKLLEGTASPELREWRFNAITNYRFNEGALKGYNVGGGYRWQDDVVIGYPVIGGPNGGYTFDLENPYKGPTEGNTDLWIGYAGKLKNNVRWKVQLNVRNVFGDKNLIPISTQQDGSWAGVRLGAVRSWSLANTFTF